MSAYVGKWRNRRIDVNIPRFWNGEREEERALRARLGCWRSKAYYAIMGVLQVLGLLFAFVSLAALLAVLCAFAEG